MVDIGHLLNFVDSYQPHLIAHHRRGDILITRFIVHHVVPHAANWRHEETVLVRESTGSVSLYENFFDQMVLTVPEITQYLATSGLAITEKFGSFRKDAPSRAGRGHLVLVAQVSEDASEPAGQH